MLYGIFTFIRRKLLEVRLCASALLDQCSMMAELGPEFTALACIHVSLLAVLDESNGYSGPIYASKH